MALTAERAKRTYYASIERNKRGFVNPTGQIRIRQEIWKKTAFLIHHIGRLYSVPVIHILQPIRESASYPPYKHYDRLIQELDELGVTVHDFRMVFKDYKGQAYRDPIHFTDDGNEIVAKKVVELMNQVFPHEFPGRHKIRVDFSTILNEGEQ